MTGQIKMLQCNLNRSIQATENALQLGVELNIDIIAVQEPWLPSRQGESNYEDVQSIRHMSYSQIFPCSSDYNLRPRTMFYISRGMEKSTKKDEEHSKDPDLLTVIISGLGYNLSIVNIYNQKNQGFENNSMTIDRIKDNLSLSPYCIVVGDFNEHHPDWDPYHPKSTNADTLETWIQEQGLSIMNIIGKGTFFRSGMKCPSVIDLTLATKLSENLIEDWQTLNTGSDHDGILFNIHNMKNNEQQDGTAKCGRFNTDKANWESFEKSTQELFNESRILSANHLLSLSKRCTKEIIDGDNLLIDQLDKVGEELTLIILRAAEGTIPRNRLGAKIKPWWTGELKALRNHMMRAQRNMNNAYDQASKKQNYLDARNKYFQEIKIAKKKHWSKFLEREDPASIFKALSYTKDKVITKLPTMQKENGELAQSFEEKSKALKTKLFPAPPESPSLDWNQHQEDGKWDWPKLSSDEVERACCRPSKGKAPGSDEIDWKMIEHAYGANKKLFVQVYSIFFDIGYQPKCWRKATGIVLKKPGKPDYSQPKAYRVISLLNCLGKALERILASRLGYLAETTTLLDPSQIGGRLKKSAVDACLLLQAKVESEKAAKNKTSTLFLDVKGAFDHVSKNQLLAIMSKLGLPLSLLSWVSSFLSKRQLRLSFDGDTEDFTTIQTGIPQGSPISPILFLIYIREMFTSKAVMFLSYIDDISLTVSSTSFKKNIQILEREVKILEDLGKRNAVEFDTAKTELIHFANTKESRNCILNLPGGASVEPSQSVKWLGVWFDSKLSFKLHVKLRVSQAKAAFQRMARLTNAEKGLSPLAMRQLYIACVTSISDYASQVWWKGQKNFLEMLQGLQNMALRKILGCFRTSPVRPMEVEACLCPPDVRLNHSRRKYAVRSLQLTPSHPVAKVMKENLDPYHLEDDITFKGNQVHLINQSLPSEIEIKEIEPVKNYMYPPWRRKLPYNIHIGNHSKEEEALIHLERNRQTMGRSVIVYYTDASYYPGASGVGIAFKAYDQQSYETCTEYYNIGLENINFNGELEAITRALEHAGRSTKYRDRVIIYSDSQAALLRLSQPSDKPGQFWVSRSIEAAKILKDQGIKVTLEWVPGHCDIPGNTEVDKLAKKAALEPPDVNFPMSHAYISRLINQMKIDEWIRKFTELQMKHASSSASYSNLYLLQIRKKLWTPRGTKKEICSAFFQLKLGHGYFKSYLKRIGKRNNDECLCGGHQTPRHLLLECRRYRTERNNVKDKMCSDRLTLPLLLHTNKGVEATLEYIKKTKICTRKWYLGDIID